MAGKPRQRLQLKDIRPLAGLAGASGTRSEVGNTLRQSRIDKGLGLRDLADHIRIRANHLEAIESGRFEDLPGRTYAIGFVRSYAEALGLDGEEMVRRFRDEAAGLGGTTALVFPSPAPEGRVPGGLVLAAAVVLAAIVYGGWYVLSARDLAIADLVPEVPERFSQWLAERRPTSIPAVPATSAEPRRATETTAGTTVPQPVISPALTPATPTPAAPTPVATPAPVVAASTDSATPTSTATSPPTPAPVADATTTSSAMVSAPMGPAAVPVNSGRPVISAPASAPPVGSVPAAAPVPAVAPTSGSTAVAPAPASSPVATATLTQRPGAAPPAPAAAPVAAPSAASVPETTPARAAGEDEDDSEESSTPPPSMASTGAAVEGGVAQPALDTRFPGAGDVGEQTGQATSTNLAARSPAAAPASRTALPLPAAPRSATGTDASGARVVIRATEESWVQVRDGDRNPIMTRVLARGDIYRVPNRPGLTLQAGNAGALEILVDGNLTPAIGPLGSVRRDVSLDPDRLRPTNAPPIPVTSDR